MKWIWISGLVFFFAFEGAFSSPLARFEIVPEELVPALPLSVDLEGIVPGGRDPTDSGCRPGGTGPRAAFVVFAGSAADAGRKGGF